MKTKCILGKGQRDKVILAGYIFDSLHIEQTNEDNNQRINTNYPVKNKKSDKKENSAKQPNVDERLYKHY